MARSIWRRAVPDAARRRINAARERRRQATWRKPRHLGELRRTTPFSTWGSSRGGPIDRVYIGRFLERHASAIRGRVLEIAGDEYASAYGRDVIRVDVLDVFRDNPKATIVADLADAPAIPDGSFDCVLVTQVLSWIYDPQAPLRTAHRILAPGGVLLATTPGIARIAPVESELFGEWWHWTSWSAQRVAEEVFGEGRVQVETFGNVLSAAAFLFGLGRWDLTAAEIDAHDPAFPVTVAIRADKAA